MPKRSCGCGGSSETCPRCFGTGSIDSEPSGRWSRRWTAASSSLSSLPKIDHRPYATIGSFGPKRTHNRPTAKMVCCLGCGSELGSAKLAKHVLQRCTGTRDRIHARQRHKRGVSPPSEASSASPEPPSITTTGGVAWLSCDSCGVRVKTTRLHRHVTNAHRNVVKRIVVRTAPIR
jgi:hypothetical protein